MIIDQDKKYIFIAVPKTASTTIHKVLNHLKKSNDELLQEKYHFPISYIESQITNSDDYFKFGFTRNPWDRFYSSWLEFTTRKDHLETWSSDLINEFKTFEEFVLNFSSTKWAEEIHFRPAYWYLNSKKIKIDYVGRYENLKNDLKYICNKLKILDINFEKLPKMRKTERIDNYQIYYNNQKMIDSIADYYSEDIKKYGYTF